MKDSKNFEIMKMMIIFCLGITSCLENERWMDESDFEVSCDNKGTVGVPALARARVQVHLVFLVSFFQFLFF